MKNQEDNSVTKAELTKELISGVNEWLEECASEIPKERKETYDAYNCGISVSPTRDCWERKMLGVYSSRNFIYKSLEYALIILAEVKELKRQKDPWRPTYGPATREEALQSPEEKRKEWEELKAREKQCAAEVKKYQACIKGKASDYGYILIHTTKRNSFVTLTDNKFQLKTVRSAGSLGPLDNSIKYKGKKKNSPTAKEAVAFAVAGKVSETKLHYFYVIFKARERVNSTYLPFLKGLSKKRVVIQALSWRYSTAHGYVRYRKKRRI